MFSGDLTQKITVYKLDPYLQRKVNQPYRNLTYISAAHCQEQEMEEELEDVKELKTAFVKLK